MRAAFCQRRRSGCGAIIGIIGENTLHQSSLLAECGDVPVPGFEAEVRAAVGAEEDEEIADQFDDLSVAAPVERDVPAARRAVPR